jgi:AP2 domain
MPKRGNLPRSGNGFSSRFRGVIHHRRSQRYEAHIWSEGKQTYLGGFDSECEAAMAYDLAAVKFRGQGAIANFPVDNYRAELNNLDSVCTLCPAGDRHLMLQQHAAYSGLPGPQLHYCLVLCC